MSLHDLEAMAHEWIVSRGRHELYSTNERIKSLTKLLQFIASWARAEGAAEERGRVVARLRNLRCNEFPGQVNYEAACKAAAIIEAEGCAPSGERPVT